MNQFIINDPDSSIDEGRIVSEKSQELSSIADSIMYICDEINSYWEGDDSLDYIDGLSKRAKAIKELCDDGVKPLSDATVQYLESMKAVTARSAK